MSEQNLSEANLRHQEEIRELLTKLEVVTHERDISAQKSESLEIQIVKKSDEIERVLALLMNLRGSWSWKITAPGRFLMRLFQNILRALSRKDKIR